MEPFIGNKQVLPEDLGPRLLHRFASSEGYEADSDLVSIMRALKQRNDQNRFDKIAIGVITNTDDRVPSVLTSLGLNVSPARYGTDLDAGASISPDNDIDFHCMSYDCGVEKPDKRIFEAAELMLARLLASQGGKTLDDAKVDVQAWRKVQVGDDYAKDAVGAINAGWNAVFLDVGGESPELAKLEDHHSQTLDELFKDSPIVRVQSLQGLKKWLSGES